MVFGCAFHLWLGLGISIDKWYVFLSKNLLNVDYKSHLRKIPNMPINEILIKGIKRKIFVGIF